MSDFYGLADFRLQLEARRWKIDRNHLTAGSLNGCNWYGWSSMEDLTPHNTSSGVAPSLFVYPYESIFDGRPHTGVTLEIVGCAGEADWLKLQVYTLEPGTFFERLPMARARLMAAWTAAAGLGAAMHPNRPNV